MATASAALSYNEYLRLQRLLSCQSPPDMTKAPVAEGRPARPLIHHDELLFIVTHQAFELWFTQILHEMSAGRDLLGQPERAPRDRKVPEEDIPRITDTLGRVNEILRLLIDQFRVLETMPPLNFLAFRDALAPASGFQSVQFRELEILAGMKDEERVAAIATDYTRLLSREENARLERRRVAMTFRDALFDWLRRTPVDEAFPGFRDAFESAFVAYSRQQEATQRENPSINERARAEAAAHVRAQEQAVHSYLHPGDPATASAHLSFLFLASYREEPLLRWPYTLIEKVVEFEQGLRLFRYRHARMVERLIGVRVGTGGSSGIGYLDATAFKYRVFGDLLEARNFLLQTSLLPPLPNPDVLRFRRG